MFFCKSGSFANTAWRYGDKSKELPQTGVRVFGFQDYVSLYGMEGSQLFVGVNRNHMDLYEAYRRWRESVDHPFTFDSESSMLQRNKITDWGALDTCLPIVGGHSGGGIGRRKDYICAILTHDKREKVDGQWIGTSATAREIPYHQLQHTLRNMKHYSSSTLDRFFRILYRPFAK